MTAEQILLRLRRRIRREVGPYSQISSEQVLRWIANDLKELKVEAMLVKYRESLPTLCKKDADKIFFQIQEKLKTRRQK